MRRRDFIALLGAAAERASSPWSPPHSRGELIEQGLSLLEVDGTLQ
jgi:hypothetical protein